jgi:murein DD-endopeptidase MepM/ murein hydrolase activator NlpD
MLTGMSAAKITWCVLVALALTLVPASASATDAAPAAPHWRWPTSPPAAVLHPFLAPPGPYAAGHRGVDFAAAPGDVVLAPADAVVQFAGVVVDRPVVTLRVDEHVLVSFEPVTETADTGTMLTAGHALGTVARGGHCDGVCLHVGVRVDGEYVSPMLYFAGIPPAVLLPLQ